MISTTTGKATPGRPRGFDRDVALDRAIRLFWRKGYETTSMRDLSEELGIGQPSLYNAFGNKRTLFDEVLKAYELKYGEFIDTALNEETTAVLAMQRILAEAPARYTRRGLPRGCLVASGDAGSDNLEVRAMMSRIRENKTTRLRHKLESDITAGNLADGLDAAGLAGYVMSVLSGLAQRACDGATPKEIANIANIAAKALPETMS
ncbi:TetR/AcrR family transcriptional regulator [Lysinibacter sp. HNR]|uniref:TetR/AcrR family transcriptional regulator n=1 Tax=Lysinibacter sp. HNR TaxID=3031408 RepID=UPI002435D965|nr:TetR/AcrR family transcriptional regulator [Lysinibacter sp. HNR]WGD37779.1 TetR/AcrR family transcriptional regulator [Lysinibacter sp. HNR]